MLYTKMHNMLHWTAFWTVAACALATVLGAVVLPFWVIIHFVLKFW